ncbi:GAF domain-containing protein [Kineosporia sp. J2-2]|uniref:GAF domain-containing protein n=1 Tax=Kineosporia corallincola TaxID=2835133 RepID=A0ABS5TH29_9ACTN|nr:GAF domain-containing protein [Kineosporia corallincola]MBT0770401.1 GAF domain-containing protein [Kineosporia corallincola]
MVVLPPRTPLPAGAVPSFDELCVRTASRLGSPVALMTLVDEEGQALPGAFGLAEPWSSERWTPLTHSFCQHVVTSGEPFVVANANDDPLVARNHAIMELGVIAYAGVPLIADGVVVGALCAIDHKPRLWTDSQVEELRLLSAEAALLLKKQLGG